MKKLLFAVALLIATTVTAQNAPSNYDGGSELQKAILKSRSKTTTSKNKVPKTTHKVVVTELQPPARTKEETLYYNIHKEESPSYLKKLISSDYWKAQQKIAEQEEMKGYAERVEKRKQDSITQEEIRKQNVIAMAKMKKETAEALRKQDSISNAEHQKYIDAQRSEQKKNRR